MIAHRLRRHPLAIACHFEHSLVVTWAVPAADLEPLVPPGLSLDTYDGTWGFLVLAVVQARRVRLRGMPPWAGGSHALTGYRLFVRHRDRDGRLRRGLHILRSDADHRSMCLGGNLLTHYRYGLADIDVRHRGDELAVRIATARHDADVELVASLSEDAAPLPTTSPFASRRHARRFAGPLPWTFDHEPETDSTVMVRGRRSSWRPRPVAVDVRTCRFLEREPFRSSSPRLASAFVISDIDYSWDRGRRVANAGRPR